MLDGLITCKRLPGNHISSRCRLAAHNRTHQQSSHSSRCLRRSL